MRRVVSYNAIALSYAPRSDDTVLKDPSLFSVLRGNYHHVPVIIGTQQDEGTVFSWAQTDITTSRNVASYLKDTYNFARDEPLDLLLQYYADDPRAGSPFGTGLRYNFYPQYKRLAAILGDILITAPRRAITTYMGARSSVWAYLDASDNKTPFLGTSHATSISPGTKGALDLYYLPFLYNQDPNAQISNGPRVPWPKFDPENAHILNFGNNAFFPVTDVQDNFRVDANSLVLNLTLVGHFNF